MRGGATWAAFDQEVGRVQRAARGRECTAVDSGGCEEHCKLAKCGMYLAGWGAPRMHPAAAFHDVRSRRWAGGHGWLARRAAALCCASGFLAAGLWRKGGQADATGGQRGPPGARWEWAQAERARGASLGRGKPRGGQ